MGNTRTYSREADKARRTKEGEERNAAWRALTTAQKIASLDKRIDFGYARKQRNKLKERKVEL